MVQLERALAGAQAVRLFVVYMGLTLGWWDSLISSLFALIFDRSGGLQGVEKDAAEDLQGDRAGSAGSLEVGVAAFGTPPQCVAVTMSWKQKRVVRGLVNALECNYDSAFDGIVQSRAPC